MTYDEKIVLTCCGLALNVMQGTAKMVTWTQSASEICVLSCSCSLLLLGRRGALLMASRAEQPS